MQQNRAAIRQTFHPKAGTSAEIAKEILNTVAFRNTWLVVFGLSPTVLHGLCLHIEGIASLSRKRMSIPRGICYEDCGRTFVVKDFSRVLPGGMELK